MSQDYDEDDPELQPLLRQLSQLRRSVLKSVGVELGKHDFVLKARLNEFVRKHADGRSDIFQLVFLDDGLGQRIEPNVAVRIDGGFYLRRFENLVRSLESVEAEFATREHPSRLQRALAQELLQHDEPREPTKSGKEGAGLFGPKGPHPFGAALRALARRITWGTWPRRATNNSDRVAEPSGRYPSRGDSNPEPSRGDE
jgi:hypothetical protein